MLEALKEDWRRLRRAAPGERFREYHERRSGGRRNGFMRLLWLLLGVAALAIGLLMMVAPGPGLLGLAIGAGLLARESLTVARALDRGELHARATWKRWRGRR